MVYISWVRAVLAAATHGHSTLPPCDPCGLWCPPVATRRLVCWAQPCFAPALRSRAAPRGSEGAPSPPYRPAGPGAQSDLRRYGCALSAGSRQCGSRDLSTTFLTEPTSTYTSSPALPFPRPSPPPPSTPQASPQDRGTDRQHTR